MKNGLLKTLMFAGILCIPATVAHAALYEVNSESFLATVGNIIMAGNNQASGTGQNYEVLKFKPQGNATTGSASDGSSLDQAPHGDVKVGELRAHLDANSLTSTPVLVFGFDLNQNTSFVDITALTIELPGESYSIGTGNTIRVYDYNGSGSSTAEALFQINLPYDFMTQFSNGATDEFYIGATVENANAGFEEFFLSSVYTANPPGPTPSVPEPMSMAMLGMGLGAVVLSKKRS